MVDLLAALALRCGFASPSRATVYRFLAREVVHTYRVSTLPLPVQAACYNLEPSSVVPGHQLAQLCFQHGDLPALHFAASLPWIDLYQARRRRGWHGRSRGLCDAVCTVRRI